MNDDISKEDFGARSQINPNEEQELTYWTGKFRISPDQLTDAIMSTGSTNVEEIRAYLKRMEEK